MKPRRTLKIEHLEDRNLLSADPLWKDPQSLTLSFAPDGAEVGTFESRLFETLGQDGSARDWQLEILRAAQTWAVNAAINIGLVADDGSAFGAAGDWQSDPRFGDIRIGAFEQTGDVLATAVKGLGLAGTWAGDVLLNTAYDFSSSGYDLYSVFLHEFGHVFGFDDDYADRSSVMYGYYQGTWDGLDDAHIAALQSVYGERTADAFDALFGNDTLDTATVLTGAGVYRADVTTASDRDYYRIDTTLFGSDAINIQLRAKGVSLLAPRLRVFNDRGEEIALVESLDPRDNDLALTLQAGGVVYLLVEGARDDVFGIGAYELGIGPDSDLVDHLLSEGVENLFAREPASSDSSLIEERSLTIDRYQVMHFEFTGGATELQVLDSSGRLVESATGDASGSIGANIFLAPGAYTVRVYGNSEGAGELAQLELLHAQGPNNIPIAMNDHYSTQHDKTLVVPVGTGVLANDYDPDYDIIQAWLGQDPSHGDVILHSNGSFTYIPDPGFFGTDTFTYYCADPFHQSGETTVEIMVVNHVPFVDSDIYWAPKNQQIYLPHQYGVLVNDIDYDNDTMTVILVSTTSNGTLALNSDGSFTYTPNTNFVGTDTFTYKVSDGLEVSTTVTVEIIVFDAM